MFINVSTKTLKKLSINGSIVFLLGTPLIYWFFDYRFGLSFWCMYIPFLLLDILSISYYSKKEKPSIVEEKVIVNGKDCNVSFIHDKIHHHKNFRVLAKGENFLKLETAFSWKSFGEIVTITKLDDSIEIVSTPKISTTIVDYDKNKQNVELIVQMLN